MYVTYAAVNKNRTSSENVKGNDIIDIGSVKFVKIRKRFRILKPE